MNDPVFLAIFSGRLSIYIFEGSGKVKLVGIAYLDADIFYRRVRGFQKLRSPGHTVVDQEFLWSLSDHFFKNFAEVASVQIQSLSHIFYGNGKRIILRDKGNGFIRIKLESFSVLNSASGGGTCKQGVHDQIKVSDQMKGRGFGGTGSQMEQFTFQSFGNLMGGGDKNRGFRGKSRSIQDLFCLQSAEFHPESIPHAVDLYRRPEDLLPISVRQDLPKRHFHL